VVNCYVANCYVASCVVANCVVASCYVANCMGIISSCYTYQGYSFTILNGTASMITDHCHVIITLYFAMIILSL
jgi:hypothetical protein